MGAIKTIFGGAWRVLQNMQSVIGTLLFLLIAYLIIAALIADNRPHVPQGGALVFNPQGILVEQFSRHDPMEVIFAGDDLPPEVRLRDMSRALKMAALDERITALVLILDGLAPTGPANAHYLADLIRDFKASGKPVIAWGDSYAQGHYLIAAQADTVLMHPGGSALLSGYGIYPTYLKGGLDKLGIQVNVFRHGDYKSMADPFMFDAMPDAARRSNEQLLGALWSQFLDSVARARDLDPSVLNENINTTAEKLAESGGNLAAHAVASGLVDKLATRQQMRDQISEIAGRDEDSHSFRQIDLRGYLAAIGAPSKRPSGEEIAVVVAEGAILNGEQASGSVGGRTAARHIRNARFDDNVKAIVLRIDSPGGSAFASETIRHEIDLARAAGKPVIAAMGNLAASGGYWIAASADEIFAQPTTITGSIGIVAILPTFTDTLSRMGLNVDGVGTTSLSSGYHPGMPLSPQIRSILQQSIRAGYDQFLELVATGRHMETSDVDKIAQGRVWSGVDAHNLGLVDRLGTLDDAIKRAGELAGIKDFRVRYEEDQPSFEDQILMEIFSMASATSGSREHYTPAPGQAYIRELIASAGDIIALNDPANIYALCTYCQIR